MGKWTAIGISLLWIGVAKLVDVYQGLDSSFFGMITFGDAIICANIWFAADWVASKLKESDGVKWG